MFKRIIASLLVTLLLMTALATAASAATVNVKTSSANYGKKVTLTQSNKVIRYGYITLNKSWYGNYYINWYGASFSNVPTGNTTAILNNVSKTINVLDPTATYWISL